MVNSNADVGSTRCTCATLGELLCIPTREPDTSYCRSTIV